MDALGVIGLVSAAASIGGAGIALWQAGEAKTAASEVKRVRNSMIDHRKAAELAQLQAACRQALRALAKYGPGSVPSSLAGVTPERDAAEVQEFLVSVREHRGHFDTAQTNEADVFGDEALRLLDSLARAVDADGLRDAGSRLFVLVSSFQATIKRQADLKRETVR